MEKEKINKIEEIKENKKWFSKEEINKVIDNNKITSCGQNQQQIEQTRKINNILEKIKRELFGE